MLVLVHFTPDPARRDGQQGRQTFYAEMTADEVTHLQRRIDHGSMTEVVLLNLSETENGPVVSRPVTPALIRLETL